MSAASRVERFARELSPLRVAPVRSASASKSEGRRQVLRESFGEGLEEARTYAAAVKDYVLDNLKPLLSAFEERCLANGVQLHWAADAESARARILEIVADRCPQGGVIAKGKSMATEEIHLNRALEEAGFRPVETDLGEFVVQLDHDVPSHIVTPIIHKTRREVAESFARAGLGPYTEQPEELTMQARAHLRDRFREAHVGISGVNFAIAETGRLVIVENEGNNRFSTTAPRVHIAVMGIEKLLPREADLPVFLKLLAGSSTAQRITTYVHFISGPKRPDEPDGPSEVHVVLLDNGRARALTGPYRSILRCIRCGACLNACPVYRQASGHAYEHVYCGPMGAVLAPVLEGVKRMGDLPKSSSLCGECEEVCPVAIPIPHLLLRLRHEAHREGAYKDAIPWGAFAWAATNPARWSLVRALLPLALTLPHPLALGWRRKRSVPLPQGREFRRWWHDRS